MFQDKTDRTDIESSNDFTMSRTAVDLISCIDSSSIHVFTKSKNDMIRLPHLFLQDSDSLSGNGEADKSPNSRTDENHNGNSQRCTEESRVPDSCMVTKNGPGNAPLEPLVAQPPKLEAAELKKDAPASGLQSKERREEVAQMVLQLLLRSELAGSKRGEPLGPKTYEDLVQDMASGKLNLADRTKETLIKLAAPLGGTELEMVNRAAIKQTLQLVQTFQESGWKLAVMTNTEGAKLGLINAKAEVAVSVSAMTALVQAQGHMEFGTKKAELHVVKGIASGLMEAGKDYWKGAGKAWNNPADIIDIVQQTQTNVLFDVTREVGKGVDKAKGDLEESKAKAEQKLAQARARIEKEAGEVGKAAEAAKQRIEREAQELRRVTEETKQRVEREARELRDRLEQEARKRYEDAKNVGNGVENWIRRQTS